MFKVRPLFRQELLPLRRFIKHRTNSTKEGSSSSSSSGGGGGGRGGGGGSEVEPAKAVVSDLFSSVVPNTGSTARDHLANERTFLAWARTGLTFVGLGVAIDSLVRVSNAREEEEPSQETSKKNVEEKWKVHAPASGLVLTGGAVLSFSTVRYYRVQKCLMQGSFPLNRVGLGAVIASTSLLTLASLMMTFSDDIIDTSTFTIVPSPYNLTTRKSKRDE